MSLQDEIRAAAEPYPDRKSGVMNGLRLAQEHYGWLPPDALREVAEALDLTPAHVQAVASFYDMYHLAPVGEHLVEVCTNVSCALVGAQEVVDAFERELGVRPGETSEDGKVTLRTIECAGVRSSASATSASASGGNQPYCSWASRNPLMTADR